MFNISNTIQRIAVLVQDQFNDGKVIVDVSPRGQPPPSTTKPFIGIGQGYINCITDVDSFKHIATVEMVGTIRVRPETIENYKKPYLELIQYMTTAAKVISGNVSLLNYFKQDNIGVLGIAGYFIVERLDLTPINAQAEWFNSEDKAHGGSQRTIGYMMRGSIKFPAVIESIQCD